MRSSIVVFRTAHKESETFAEREERISGREETQNGIQRGAACQVETGILGESILDGEKTAAALERFRSKRGADQDLVSEQAGEDQKGERTEKSAGSSIDGARSLQSFHRAGGRGRRGDRRNRKKSLNSR